MPAFSPRIFRYNYAMAKHFVFIALFLLSATSANAGAIKYFSEKSAEQIACMTMKAKEILASKCDPETSCRDEKNFLLWCAGFEPDSSFNASRFKSKNFFRWKTGEATLDRCCGASLPANYPMTMEESCQLLLEECTPCPIGTCFDVGSKSCKTAKIGNAQTCACPSKDLRRDPLTGSCVCPPDSKMISGGGPEEKSCLCNDIRKAPSSLPGAMNCVCRPGLISDVTTGACKCQGEGVRSQFDVQEKMCICKSGYKAFTNGPDREDITLCCAPDEVPNYQAGECEKKR